MSAVIYAIATKPTPDTKIGIKSVIKNNCVKITKVVEGGLFSTSGLKEGQEIITINGTHVDGLSIKEVEAILDSSKTEIHITARPEPFTAFFNINNDSYQMNCNRHKMPEILETASVPLHKWRKIYDLIKTVMVENTKKSVKMGKIFKAEMSAYTSTQMGKGFIGFGQESHHEKKVINMTHQCAVLDNNATLVATDVSIRANALLAPHGIMASLFMMSVLLPKYSTKQRSGENNEAYKPVGLRFMSIE